MSPATQFVSIGSNKSGARATAELAVPVLGGTHLMGMMRAASHALHPRATGTAALSVCGTTAGADSRQPMTAVICKSLRLYCSKVQARWLDVHQTQLQGMTGSEKGLHTMCSVWGLLCTPTHLRM